jgi:putative molybdopterin biosynthesis protein
LGETDLLLTTDVATLLRVHPKQVYRLLKQGLPARRVGGEWRFARDEVLRWSAAGGSSIAPAAAVSPELAGVAPAPLLAANGDVVVDILLRRIVAEEKPLVGFLRADRATALAHLAARRIVLAGHHGDAPPPKIDATRLARIHLVNRKVGLAHRPNVRLRSLADLAHQRLASRPKTAGVRAHLDRALEAKKLTLAKLRVRASEFDSHEDAVTATLRDEANVALTTAAWARRAGLAFLPIASEAYNLLVFAEYLGSAVVVGVCEAAQSKAFVQAARAAGYDAARAGEIRYEPPR